MHDDHQLTREQAERVWARVEAFIADDGSDELPGGWVEPSPAVAREIPRDRAPWLRAAIVVVLAGLAVVLAVALRDPGDQRQATQTLTVADLARRAGGARPVALTAPRSLVVKVQHPDAVEREENWIDASGRGCFQSEQLQPVADPGGGPQCGDDMVRIGGLTLSQLAAVAEARDPASALEGALIADDDLNTPGVRAELVATLLAWGHIDPRARAAGFELLDRSGFVVEEATPERIALVGPGADGQIRVVVDPATTQVRSYGATDGPTRRTFAPGQQPLPG